MVDGLKNKRVDHELKFTVNNNRSHQIIEWLTGICEADPEFPAATVSSIYYDTKNWKFLREKINSDFLKTKVRLRWYSDINNNNHSDFSFLEAKFKIGNRRDKLRVKTQYTGDMLSAIPLESPKLFDVLHVLAKEGLILNENIFPVFVISYKRLRFIEPYSGSRVCIDYDITAPRVNACMLSKNNFVYQLNKAVFEIKGEIDELPAILYPLTDQGLTKESFSKYSMCLKQILDYTY